MLVSVVALARWAVRVTARWVVRVTACPTRVVRRWSLAGTAGRVRAVMMVGHAKLVVVRPVMQVVVRGAVVVVALVVVVVAMR